MTHQLSPTDQLSRADDRLTVPAQGLLHQGHALPQLWATWRLSFRLQVPAAAPVTTELPDDLAAALCAAGLPVGELDPGRLRYQGALVSVLGHGQRRRDAIEHAVKTLRMVVNR